MSRDFSNVDEDDWLHRSVPSELIVPIESPTKFIQNNHEPF